MSKRNVSLLVLGAVGLLVLIIAPDVLLLVFAGVLVALFLRGGGRWIACRTGIAPPWGIAIFLLVTTALLSAAFFAFWPAILAQFAELSDKLPEAADSLREAIASWSWGDQLLDKVSPKGLLSSGGGRAAASAVTGTFGLIGNLVIVLFIGLYGAFDPAPYRRAFLCLLAPSIRPRGEEVLDKVCETLLDWLAAKLMSMAVVGILTGAGLWLLGVPLALLLGLIAGLLAFIPNVGPVLAAVPGLLLAMPDGTRTVVMVAGVYVAVQALESYVITPMIQQRQVSIPPAFIISAQVLIGSLFGLIGLALATPLAATIMVLVREVYVGDYLEGRPSPQEG